MKRIATNCSGNSFCWFFSLISLHFLFSILKHFNFKIVEFYAEMLLFFAAIQIFIPNAYTKKHLFCFWQYVYAVECWLYYDSAAWIYLQHRNNFWSQPASVLLLWSFLSWSGRCVFFADLHGYMPESVLFFLLQSLLLQERVMELNFHCWVYSHPKRSRLLLCSLWHLFYPEIPVSRQSFRLQSLQHFTWVFWFSQRTLEVQWSSLSHISLWYMLQHEMLVILHLESAVVQLQQLLHIICSVMSASESRMERSYGSLSEWGISDCAVTLCHWYRGLVRHGIIPGFSRIYPCCQERFYLQCNLWGIRWYFCHLSDSRVHELFPYDR